MRAAEMESQYYDAVRDIFANIHSTEEFYTPSRIESAASNAPQAGESKVCGYATERLFFKVPL